MFFCFFSKCFFVHTTITPSFILRHLSLASCLFYPNVSIRLHPLKVYYFRIKSQREVLFERFIYIYQAKSWCACVLSQRGSLYEQNACISVIFMSTRCVFIKTVTHKQICIWCLQLKMNEIDVGVSVESVGFIYVSLQCVRIGSVERRMKCVIKM